MGVEKNFVVADAGMNRSAAADPLPAFHAIQPVVLNTDQKLTADVVGPICETSDFLARDREMVVVRNGDLLAVMSTGAYGFSMSSNYCSRPRVAEVMVSEDHFHIIRARQSDGDPGGGETVPPFFYSYGRDYLPDPAYILPYDTDISGV